MLTSITTFDAGKKAHDFVYRSTQFWPRRENLPPVSLRL
jgi:hypothetical protein